MPHKRNPIGSEQISGLARVLRANAQAALEDVALWHERDISHSSVERVILPDSTILLDYLQHRATALLQGMVVDERRMRENLELTRGALFSSALLLALVRAGMGRDEAYRIVQAAAQRALTERIDMRTVVAAEPAIQALNEAGTDGFDLDQIFDYKHYTRYAAEIVARLDGLH
jgi:adenylosuccinate lyase